MSARLLAATILVLSGCVEADDAPEGTFSAAVTDPSGDGGTADVVSATLDIAEGSMLVRVVLTPASFQADSMLLVFNLDTDENPDRQGSAAPIEVDGGVDMSNAARIVEAGGTILVAGNPIFGTGDPERATRELRAAATLKAGV